MSGAAPLINPEIIITNLPKNADKPQKKRKNILISIAPISPLRL